MSFSKEPVALKIYLSLIVVAGLVFLSVNFPEIGKLGWPFLFFILLHVAFENLEIPLPHGHGYVSVGFALDVAMIILFGPAATAWANVIVCVSDLKLLRELRGKYHRIFFNISQLALSTGLAGHVYLLLGGEVGRVRLAADLLPLVGSVAVYLALNVVSVALVISLSQKVSFRSVFLTNMRWALPNYLALAPLGLLLAVVHLNMGIVGVLLLTIPLLLARHTFILYMDMRNQYLDTIKALTRAIDAKDHYTHGHSERVAEYAVLIGQELRLREDFLEKLEAVAFLHDIGKIGIPEPILNKPGRLSEEEFDQMRDHAVIGAEIIQNIKFVSEYADVVRHHHERVDGYGYPNGMPGTEMSLGTRIVAVADAFDAMTSERPYHRPKTLVEAVDELQRCCDTQFCRDVTDALVRVLRRRGEI